MYLFYLLIFLIPFPEYKKFASVAGDLTLIKIVGIATIIYAIFYRLTSADRMRLLPQGGPIIFLILFFVALFSIHFSLKVISDWAVHLALFYVVMVFVDSVDVIKKTFAITIVSLIINCYQSVRGIYLYGWYDRAAGSFGDANYFALALLVAIGFCVALLCTDHNYKYGKLAAILVMFIILLLTSSRGGMLGFAIMTLLYIKDSEYKVKIILILLCILLPLAIVVAPKTIQRLQNKDYSTQSSTENRINLQLTGLKMVKANPWTGVGYGNFKSNVPTYSDNFERRAFVAHNTYLSIAAEQGLPMLVLFLLLLASVYRCINKYIVININKPDNVMLLRIIKYIFVGYTVSILFLTAEREKYLWLIIFMVMAISKMKEFNQSNDEIESA